MLNTLLCAFGDKELYNLICMTEFYFYTDSSLIMILLIEIWDYYSGIIDDLCVGTKDFLAFLLIYSMFLIRTFTLLAYCFSRKSEKRNCSG